MIYYIYDVDPSDDSDMLYYIVEGPEGMETKIEKSFYNDWKNFPKGCTIIDKKSCTIINIEKDLRLNL